MSPLKISFSLLFSCIFLACNREIARKRLVSCTPQKREFRAVWIATVSNIDWPSNKNLTVLQQKQEIAKVLDFQQDLKLNAVLVQVRAAADAFYTKSPEPWSEWLMGQQGKAPSPAYDPMQLMIEECHTKGLEFHAWLNLNRGRHKTSQSIADNHITKTKPEWFVQYDGYWIFNLGIPEVRQYLTDIVGNIVKNYDVDGIHFDDYFYPYTVEGQNFNDAESFKRYGKGFANIDDWRRNNVDLVIRAIADRIKKEKNWVKFGISPFGVWRNQHKDTAGSATQAGQTSYDNLYADTRKWYREGWIDYIAPQIYFSRNHPTVPYQTLANWWVVQPSDRHLYIGQAAYKVGTEQKDKGWADMSEIPSQICFNRGSKRIQGSIFFSSKSLINNSLGFTDNIKTTLYMHWAFPPTMPWKDKVAPNPPQNLKTEKTNEGIQLRWQNPKRAEDGDVAHYFVIYRFGKKDKINLENTAKIIEICYDARTHYFDDSAQKGQKYTYIITTFDRLHNESEGAKVVVEF